MQLLSPIQSKFSWEGNTVMVNQLFGENPDAMFYGPKGHDGIDFQTTFDWKYEPYNQSWLGEKPTGNWKRIAREPEEREGHIPTIATHEGWLKTNFFQSDERRGYGVTVTSEVMDEDGKKVQYQTLHFHLIAPWQTLAFYSKTVPVAFREKKVRAGEIIGMCGNTGQYTTGPHLHYQLQKRWLNESTWSEWTKIDPMPYFSNTDVVFHRWLGGQNHRWFYQGKEVTEIDATATLNSLPQIV